MADKTEFLQAIDDAILDADSLERFINGSDSETVLTRLSAEYPTLQNAIKQMFENGGLPATPFETKALMEASALVDGDYAMVTDDTDNNGLYVKTAGAWVKSAYDPFGYANILARKLREESWGIINPAWEKGTIGSSGSKLDGSAYLNRARLVEGRILAPNTLVTVTSNDPDLGVTIGVFDKDNVYKIPDGYSTEKSRLVEYEYTLVARYFDDRAMELETLGDKISITHSTKTTRDIESNTKAIESINASVYGTQFTPVFVNGALQGKDGGIWGSASATATRLITNPIKLKHIGDIEVNLVSTDQKFLISRYDRDGIFLGFSPWYTTKQTIAVDGYYALVIAWTDDRPISPVDADVTVAYPKLIDDSVNTEIHNKIDALQQLLLTGDFKAEWESGSYTGSGTYYANNKRLRMVGGKVPYTGLLKVSAIEPLQVVNIITFDKQGEFTGYGSLSPVREEYIDGFFDIVIAYSDERVMVPEDANITIELLGKTGTSSEGASFDPTGIPRFSSVPFGHLLGKTLAELQTAFETLVANYHGTTKKESIGFSTSGNHEMFVYTLTPEEYQITVAVTMHTHGNERWNPLGFYALLNEMSKAGNKHELIIWLRNNVRWIVVPIASPSAVVANTRNTNGVNLNRNYDYLWELYPNDKGPSVYSLSESKNISNYFKPLKDELDYHMDLHDIPGSSSPISPNSYAYMPANLTEIPFQKEQDAVRDYLGEMNNVRTGGKYTMDGGGTTNFFAGVLGVPSVTPEHVTQHWLQRGLTGDQQIAKALEQTCCFLYLFRYMHQLKDVRNSSYYERRYETSFASKEFGIYDWTKEQVYSALDEIEFLTTDATEPNVYRSISPLENTPTILVVSGSTDDDNNSDLTVLRVMQNVDNADMMFVNHLKNSNLVVVPAILQNTPALKNISEHLTHLVTKYSPDYTVLVTATGFEAAVGRTSVSSDSENNFTSMTEKSGVLRLAEVSGLAESLTGRFTVINLENEVRRHAAYPHTVAKWVGLVANDLASYYSEIINN